MLVGQQHRRTVSFYEITAAWKLMYVIKKTVGHTFTLLVQASQEAGSHAFLGVSAAEPGRRMFADTKEAGPTIARKNDNLIISISIP